MAAEPTSVITAFKPELTTPVSHATLPYFLETRGFYPSKMQCQDCYYYLSNVLLPVHQLDVAELSSNMTEAWLQAEEL